VDLLGTEGRAFAFRLVDLPQVFMGRFVGPTIDMAERIMSNSAKHEEYEGTRKCAGAASAKKASHP
jgi:hypothetical protein